MALLSDKQPLLAHLRHFLMMPLCEWLGPITEGALRGQAPTVFPFLIKYFSSNILIIFLDNQVQAQRLEPWVGTWKQVVHKICICTIAILSLILHPWKHTLLIAARAAIPRPLRFCLKLCWVLSLCPEKGMRCVIRNEVSTSCRHPSLWLWGYSIKISLLQWHYFS
jgi:hypothetical protein